MAAFPELTFDELRYVLRQHDVRCNILAEEWEGRLYVFVLGEGDALKFQVVHVADEREPLSMFTVRSVCAALGLGPDIFGLTH